MGRFKDDIITTKADWTVKQLYEYSDQGAVVFDNVIQRNLVWNKKQKSLLIDSLLWNYMPPKFIANKKGDTFDMVDGKQRHNAISSFIKNEYKLSGLINRADKNGELYILNDKYFKDLDPELQDKLTGRSLEILVMDNATQEQVKEYFFRINNGTQLSSARKTLAKARSFSEIINMSQHPIFNYMFSKTAIDGDDSKNIVMRSYAIIYCENKSLEKKKVSPYFNQTEMTEDGIKTVIDCYDTLVDAYELIKERDEKSEKKILQKMMKKTHTITLVPIVKIVNDEKIEIKVFADWLCRFFAPIDVATISSEYNEGAKSGSSKVGAVEARLKAMTDDFMELITK